MLDIAQARGLGAAFVRRWRLASDCQDVFGGEAGQRVLAYLVQKAGLFETPMVAGDAYMTAFRVGRQSLALELLALLRFDAERLIALSQKRDEQAEAA